MEAKTNFEQHILWKIGYGNISFWWDNQLGIGPLARQVPQGYRSKKITVSLFINSNRWKEQELRKILPDHNVYQILNITIEPNREDYPIWLADENGEFSCKSAWKATKVNRNSSLTPKKIWRSKIPFKVSFLC